VPPDPPDAPNTRGKFFGGVFRLNFPKTAGGSGVLASGWRDRRVRARGMPAVEVFPGA